MDVATRIRHGYSLTPARFCMWLASLVMAAILVAPNAIQAETAFNRHRIFIVSSYDRDYLWSQSTHRGVVAAMRQHGYLESTEQAESFAAADYLESPG